MDLQDIVQVVSRLNIQQKAELVEFIRNQSTDDLPTALQEISDKLDAMGVDISLNAGNLENARRRLEALQSLTKLL